MKSFWVGFPKIGNRQIIPKENSTFLFVSIWLHLLRIYLVVPRSNQYQLISRRIMLWPTMANLLSERSVLARNKVRLLQQGQPVNPSLSYELRTLWSPSPKWVDAFTCCVSSSLREHFCENQHGFSNIAKADSELFCLTDFKRLDLQSNFSYSACKRGLSFKSMNDVFQLVFTVPGKRWKKNVTVHRSCIIRRRTLSFERTHFFKENDVDFMKKDNKRHRAKQNAYNLIELIKWEPDIQSMRPAEIPGVSFRACLV